MPRNRTCLSLSVMLLLAVPYVARAQGADLFAHGSGERLWLAEVVQLPEPQAGERTILRMRRTGAGNTQWVEVARLSSRIEALANRGNDLVVLLSTGDWLIVWTEGRTPGPPLPQGRRILAIGSDEHSLWAVGSPPPETTAATVPATALSSGDDEAAPDISPQDDDSPEHSPPRPALFLLERGRWAWQTDLPRELRLDEIAQLSLGVVQSRPVLAVNRELVVEIHEYTIQDSWAPRGRINLREAGPIKILPAGARAALWSGGSGGAGELYIRTERWSEALPLQVSMPVRQAQARTLTSAGGNLRLYFLDNARVHEQSYAPDGTPIGSVVELTFPRAPAAPQSQWPSIALMAALMFILFGTIRRRATLPGGMVDQSKLALAPLLLRLLAAAIDFSPVVITAAVVMFRHRLSGDAAEVLVELLSSLAVQIALVGYIVYTCATEYFTGRTIGKMIFSLKVAGLDGGKPRAGALILRNLLRVLDLSLGLIIIVLMVFSPLQQRVGDIAAGTVVVLQNPPRDEQDLEPADDEKQP